MDKSLKKDLIKDLQEAYEKRNYQDMADIYDELILRIGDKYEANRPFFCELLQGGKVIFPKLLMGILDIADAPFSITLQKHNEISFDRMFEGATMEDTLAQRQFGKCLAVISLNKSGEFVFTEEMQEALKAKPGDVLFIEAINDDGFSVRKFLINDFVQRCLNRL